MSAALDIQHVQRMCCTILLSVTCQALQCSSTLPHKLHGFWKNVTEHKKMCLNFMYNLDTLCTMTRFKRDTIKVYSSSCKVPDILVILRHAVAQLVEALRYKSEGRGLDSRL